MVFSENYIAGKPGVVYRCFFLTSFGTGIFATGALSPRKWSTTRIGFKCYPVRKLHQRSGEGSWAICYYVVCGRRRHVLQFLEHGHHRTPASGRYQPFISVGAGDKAKCLHFTGVRCLLLTAAWLRGIALFPLYRHLSSWVSFFIGNASGTVTWDTYVLNANGNRIF
jgi:hypothetical protein